MKKKILSLMIALSLTVSPVSVIGAAAEEINTETSYSAFGKAGISAPVLNAGTVKYQYVSLTWKTVKGASGYEIYGYSKSKNQYQLLYTAKANTNKYERKLGYGRDDMFKVRAFSIGKDGKKIFGPYSNVCKTKTAAPAPKITSVSKKDGKSLIVKWSKATSAEGYQIYRYIKKTGNFRLVKTINNGNTTSYTDTGLVNGRTYYYKIKSVRQINGKAVAGTFSSPVGNTVSDTGSTSTVGSNGKGATIPQYNNIVVKEVDPNNFDRTLNLALLEAEEKANRNTQYKIVIPPGSYQAGRVYRIPSNTHVYARGATINATKTRVTMFSTYSDRRSENIIMEGGVWSTLSQPDSVDGTPVRILGVENVVFQDLTIETKRKGHIIEAADVIGFTIKGCTFSGNNKDSKPPYKNVQPKEALQLDVATESALPSFTTTPGMLNGKGCHNVIISNNRFINCARGLGSHSGTGNGAEKQPYTNITVVGNTIRNTLGEGIYAQDWRNCTIQNNTINDGRQAGIFLLDASNTLICGNSIDDMGKYTGQRKSTYDPRGIYGVGMLIRHCSNLYVNNNRISRTYQNGISQEGESQRITLKNNKIIGLKK